MSLRRQRGLWLGIAVIMVIIGGLLTAGVGQAASAAAPQLTAARSIPGLNALNAGGNARVNTVSCGSTANCAFGGSGTDASGHVQGFVADLSAAAGAGGSGPDPDHDEPGRFFGGLGFAGSASVPATLTVTR